VHTGELLTAANPAYLTSLCGSKRNRRFRSAYRPDCSAYLTDCWQSGMLNSTSKKTATGVSTTLRSAMLTA
jgi:hypothetical protein